MRLARLLVVVMLAAGMACSESTYGGGGGGGRTLNLQVGNNFFSPTPDTVSAGLTVTWTWNPGGVAHTVTFEDGVTSGLKSSGTYPRAFSSAGTYRYRCTQHSTTFASGMIGTIVVQ